MATFAKQSANAAGVAVTYGAVSASDDWVNSGSERLHVKNGGGGACTVTIVAVGACDQGSLHDRVVSVPAGSDRYIGPFPPGRFTSPTTNKATVTFSPTTSVTAALLG